MIDFFFLLITFFFEFSIKGTLIVESKKFGLEAVASIIF